jgi:hypothetical protein
LSKALVSDIGELFLGAYVVLQPTVNAAMLERFTIGPLGAGGPAGCSAELSVINIMAFALRIHVGI